jgi:hypothetical protein
MYFFTVRQEKCIKSFKLVLYSVTTDPPQGQVKLLMKKMLGTLYTKEIISNKRICPLLQRPFLLHISPFSHSHPSPPPLSTLPLSPSPNHSSLHISYRLKIDLHK